MCVTPEVQSLRANAVAVYAFDHGPGLPTATAAFGDFVNRVQIENLAGEFRCRMKQQAASSSAARAEFVLTDRTGRWFSLAMEIQTSAAAKVTGNGKSIELPPTANPEREFHLVLDASVAELICDNQHALTIRIYRKPDGPLRLSADSDLRKVSSLQAWQLRPISRNRLTT